MSCSWRANAALAMALHPSTSKEYVFPLHDLALFTADHFASSDGGESVLNNFLKLERNQLPNSSFFRTVQTEVTVEMRSVVCQWMSEVCEEERCSCEVFPLAVSYLDRFLSVEAVHKKQLQALATACLFLASKVKLPRQFEGGRLVLYTDGGVSMSELLSWELLVLNRLKWDISSLTPFDFLDQYTHRLRLANGQMEAIRLSINYLVVQTAIDFRIAILPPSVIAAVCLNVALSHAYGEQDVSFQTFAVALEKTVQLVMDPMKPYAAAIYELINRHEAAFGKYRPPRVLRPLQLPSFSLTFAQMIKRDHDSMESENGGGFSTASTPTDITDVTIF